MSTEIKHVTVCACLFLLMSWILLPTPGVTGPCEDLKNLSLPDTEITIAESPPLPFTSPTSSFGFAVISIPFCRVAATARPTADSVINFEVWMPTPGWNGKFNGVGNGALGGGINYPAMKPSLLRGYATASTDTGHIGASNDASWAYTVNPPNPPQYHPEKVIDWGHRAIHMMTVASKAIVNSFYGTGPQLSYFTGCSGGGQQGLSEAQKYPGDYDGIVAGAPSNFFTHLDAGQIWRAQANLKDPAGFIPFNKLATINNAVLANCDVLDGIMDGFLDDPRRCDFDPSTLLCPDADADTCLTAAQVETLNKLYTDPANPRTGKQIFPAFPPGSELGWAQFIGNQAGPNFKKPNPIANSFFKYMVFENLNWDYLTFDFDEDMAYTDAKLITPTSTLASAINSTNPDLLPFNDLGGKLIMYHGWNDPNIPTQNSINYYEGVLTQGPTRSKEDFLRLFLVPGMGHCSGGPGPNTFDSLAALEQWVEQGIAPDKIIGSNPTSGLTRPLCPYPQVARYSGEGSENDAANFMCVPPIEVRIEPETLNLKSKGEFTAFITVPKGFDVRDWGVSDVVCEGAPAVKGMVSGGGRTYAVKFNKKDLKNIEPGREVTFTVEGTFHHNGGVAQFQGNDTVRVIK